MSPPSVCATQAAMSRCCSSRNNRDCTEFTTFTRTDKKQQCLELCEQRLNRKYQSPPTANTRYSSAPRPPQPFQQQSSVVALSQIIEYSYISRSMLIYAHCALPIARQRRVVMNLIGFEYLNITASVLSQSHTPPR